MRSGNVEPTFSLGLEEEYLLVDLATRDLVSDPPAELLQRCISETDGRVSPEFLRSQLEVKTSVCASVSSMRRELALLRRKVCDVTGHGPERGERRPFAPARGHCREHRHRGEAEPRAAGGHRMYRERSSLFTMSASIRST